MRHFFSLLLLAVTVTSCGDGEGPTDMIPAELEGSWEAAPSCVPDCGFTLARIDNPADSVNFVSALQQTFVLSLTLSGRFSLASTSGGTTIRGRAHTEGSMLIVRDDAGAQDTADYTLQNDVLGLRFRNVTEQFDFDDDGVGDPSTIRAYFRRQ